jgi:acyl-CoA hydrolase
MVAVDDNGKPTAVPPLKLESEFERKLFEAGKMRKEMREEAVRRNKEITADIPEYNTDVAR